MIKNKGQIEITSLHSQTIYLEAEAALIQPLVYSLSQNYPNPFNPSTTISFEIPEKCYVKLIVYDILGREVRTLVDEMREAGVFSVNFDAYNLPTGVYFYRMEANKFIKVNKMILLK